MSALTDAYIAGQVVEIGMKNLRTLQSAYPTEQQQSALRARMDELEALRDIINEEMQVAFNQYLKNVRARHKSRSNGGPRG